MAKPEVADLLRPGTHAATFGGNPIACRAALALIETIEADGLLERAGQIAARFTERFEGLKPRCPLVREVRACGVMIGIELAVEGAPVVAECLRRRLLINCTHGTVLRLLPSLTLTDAELEEGCDVIEAALLAQPHSH